jgi:lipoprotein-releasing system ATP-binding protein
VGRGDRVAIVGVSGSGKTTFLQLLGGLDDPTAGEVRVAGNSMTEANDVERGRLRNRALGFVYQFHHLLPEFTALENVEMPFRIGRRRPEERTSARKLLSRLGLAERLDHRPSELSGGEQQRVAVARAVVAEPALVLADEPTGNLDPATGRRVFELLRELQVERSFSLVLATHSARLAAGCDRVLRLVGGRLGELGAADARRHFDGLGAGDPPSPLL